MKCPHCGTSGLQDSHCFCFKCGKKIFRQTEIEHERTSVGKTLNAKHEKNYSFGEEGNGQSEVNVTREESGQSDENQMKRKPLHENDDLPVKDPKIFVSDPDHADTQSGNVKSTSYNALTSTVYLQNDGNSTAGAPDNSPLQPRHSLVVGPELNNSVSETGMDTIVKDAKDAEVALQNLAIGLPKQVIPARRETNKMDESSEKGSVADGVPSPRIPEGQIPVKEIKCNLGEEGRGETNKMDESKEKGSVADGVPSPRIPEGQIPVKEIKCNLGEEGRGETNKMDESSEKGSVADGVPASRIPEGQTPVKEIKCNLGEEGRGETNTMDESGKKGPVADGVPAPRIPEGHVQTPVKETTCSLEQDKNDCINENSSTQNKDQSAKNTRSENETPTDEGEFKNVEEDKDVDFGQDKNERSNHVEDVKQVANDPMSRREPSSGSQKPSISEVKKPDAQGGKNVDGGSKSNGKSLVKHNQIDKNISSEQNKTPTDERDRVENASDHRKDNQRTDKHKDVVAAAGKVNKAEEKQGYFYQKQQNEQPQPGKSKRKAKDKKNKAKGWDPLTSSESTATIDEADKVAVPGKVNILDVFAKDKRDRMTVVFHAILAPQFNFNQKEGDQVFMRFGGPAFKDFNLNILEMKPLGKLEGNFELLEGRLSAPVDVLRDKIPYKYIVLKGKKEKSPYVWEHLPGHGPYRNRCLKISKDRCLSGVA